MMDFVFFVAGLGLLVVGAELLVRGASRLALAVGISPLVVGLTVVAYGTSAPEVAVSVGAAFAAQTDIAIGNVVGSNIFNVLFILGLSALIVPLVINRQIIRQEVPIMIGVSVLCVALAWNGMIGVLESGLLVALLFAYTIFLVVQSRRETQRNAADVANEVDQAGTGGWASSRLVQVGLILAGLVCLVIGSRFLVSASIAFAQSLGVSELVIGLTIVAAGTSLPEVATSITAAIKGERDIAVGNVIGSNIFNILGALGLSGLAAGVAGADGLGVASSVMAFDIWVMLATAVACIPIFLSGREIARWEGFVFVAYYVFYITYLILSAERHAALETMTTAMVYFVIPLTLVTAAAIYLRSNRTGDV
ncbi:MAG: calcium/sodium antiporter [Tabrizicola sp.]|uniref:calcium/sodium antiporter n=1 Tax=Tabrizicola sp. TaxID=2005166 RepID=UPI0027328C4D|nr:calcium/sodium antiporter [Tabrizicola sp.]MDP3261714.1 calcium/sodium antiporter [Tabrizicola sp.]MDP3648216.1 calcium/sodium antiporter [Paracoccaceae bacterium]MDZ4067232.1 calcium/sodium antiporter [Tabrizicola sp.]